MKDYDFINKIEDMVEKRRRADPLQQEMDRLLNEIYPIETIGNVYKLGYCHAFAVLKKDFSKYFCEYDQEIVSEIIRNIRKDKVMDEIINKLL